MEAIKNPPRDYFKNLISIKQTNQGIVEAAMGQFLSYIPSLVLSEDSEHLIWPITIEEVKVAVF